MFDNPESNSLINLSIPFFPSKGSPLETISVVTCGNLFLIIKIYSCKFFVSKGSQKPEKEILPEKLIELNSLINFSNIENFNGVGIFGYFSLSTLGQKKHLLLQDPLILNSTEEKGGTSPSKFLVLLT